MGELLGYSLRSVSGYFADKTQRYWFFTALGYVVKVLAVPALALAGNWPLAAVLIIAITNKFAVPILFRLPIFASGFNKDW